MENLERVVAAPDQPVIVVSMGRSGSTLLQRCLNLHPALTVWGEHAGILTPLTMARHRVVTAANNAELLTQGYSQRDDVVGVLGDRDAFIAWASPFAPEQFVAKLRAFILDVFYDELPTGVRWGFKEIRYTRAELKFMVEMFPQAQIVVLYRDPRAQVRSLAQTFVDPDHLFQPGGQTLEQLVNESFDQWLERYRGYLGFHEHNGSRCRVLSFEDFVGDVDHLVQLFEWLGFDAPPTADIADVLQRSSGSSAKVTRWSAEQKQALDEMIANHDSPAVNRVHRRLIEASGAQ